LTTLKLISEYCGLLLPFLSAFYAGLCAYLDKYRGWRLAAHILFIVYLIAVGSAAVHNRPSS
jgi:hypothetical protein